MTAFLREYPRLFMRIGALVVAVFGAGLLWGRSRAGRAEGQAAELYRAGGLADAEAAYSRALAHWPGSPSAHYGYAKTLLALRQLDRAGVEFRAVAELDSRRAWPYWGLGQTRFLEGRYEDAQASFREHARRDPGSPQAGLAEQCASWAAAGERESRAKLYIEAMRHYYTAANACWQTSDALHCDLAKMYVTLGDRRAAREELGIALRNDADRVCAHPAGSAPPWLGTMGHRETPHSDREACALLASIRK